MWNVYATCTCGWFVVAPFGNKYHVHIWICPKCGADKTGWYVVKARFVSDSTWWKPSTWFNRHLEGDDANDSK